jgi:hypothetical protein
MTILRLFIISLCLCIVSCRTETSTNKQFEQINGMLLDLNVKYDSIKGSFPSELLSHFPELLDSNLMSFNENISGHLDIVRVEIVTKATKEVLVFLENEFHQKSIALYTPGDSCLLIPARHITTENILKQVSVNELKTALNLNSKKCTSEKLPIPNFWNTSIVAKQNSCFLPDDYLIYVLKSGRELLIDHKISKEISVMPKEWKNGYSEGVAISTERSLIIYWAIIW